MNGALSSRLLNTAIAERSDQVMGRKITVTFPVVFFDIFASVK